MNRIVRLPRGRFLQLEPFSIMAIVNVTPDSFYAPSRQNGADAARGAALAALHKGADCIDIGGESTRPGSAAVSAEEELARVVPAVAALRAVSDVPISVDTKKSAVARAALEAGADIINDVSAGADPGMIETAAEFGAALVLMHMRGEPGTMQKGLSEAAPYADCPREVADYLCRAAERALAAGVGADAVLLDPGIGFGKRLEDNLALIARIGELCSRGYPVLVGLSRKSFVGAVSGRPVEDRLAGSLGAAAAAWEGGARVFRVHDPAETRDALALYAACRTGRAPDKAEGGRPWISA